MYLENGKQTQYDLCYTCRHADIVCVGVCSVVEFYTLIISLTVTSASAIEQIVWYICSYVGRTFMHTCSLHYCIQLAL